MACFSGFSGKLYFNSGAVTIYFRWVVYRTLNWEHWIEIFDCRWNIWCLNWHAFVYQKNEGFRPRAKGLDFFLQKNWHHLGYKFFFLLNLLSNKKHSEYILIWDHSLMTIIETCGMIKQTNSKYPAFPPLNQYFVRFLHFVRPVLLCFPYSFFYMKFQSHNGLFDLNSCS